MLKLFIVLTSLTLLNFANADTRENFSSQPATIEVLGQAAVSIAPDAFNVTFVFEEMGMSVAKLNQTMQMKHDKLVKSLLELGVAKSDVQSLNIQLYPTYEHRNGTQSQTGFKLSREVRVTSGSVEKYATTIDVALGHGVARVQGFQLFNRNSETLYKTALEAALDNAQNTAQQIARKLGAQVGKALRVQTTNGSHSPVPVMARKLLESAAHDMPGEVDVNANVSVVYELNYRESKRDQ